MPRKFDPQKFRRLPKNPSATMQPRYVGEPGAQAVATSYGAASIIVGFCSFLVVPLVLGPAGIILGALALAQGDSRGAWGILLGIAGPVVTVVMAGVLFAFVLTSGLMFGL